MTDGESGSRGPQACVEFKGRGRIRKMRLQLF